MDSSKIIIIWDFNGTLLDDTLHCVVVMNRILHSRGYPPISVDYYREVFGFPVKNYYAKAGFDLNIHKFEELSKEFITGYYNDVGEKAGLHDKTHETLQFFKDQGIKQYILSAMEHESLVKLTKKFNIHDYFESVWGIDNHHANGKTDIAKKHLRNIDAEKVFYIGDTDHDYEVAKLINAKIIFHPHGSQSKERLCHFKDACFVDKLFDLTKIIL